GVLQPVRRTKTLSPTFTCLRLAWIDHRPSTRSPARVPSRMSSLSRSFHPGPVGLHSSMYVATCSVFAGPMVTSDPSLKTSKPSRSRIRTASCCPPPDEAVRGQRGPRRELVGDAEDRLRRIHRAVDVQAVPRRTPEPIPSEEFLLAQLVTKSHRRTHVLRCHR